MKTKVMLTAAILVLLAGVRVSVRAETHTVDAPISRVTVYPDRARVTRVATLDLDSGEHALVFEDLPVVIPDESFRASATGPEGTIILRLTYRQEQHLQSPREKVAALERRLDELTNQKKQPMQDRAEAFNQQKQLLRALTDGATRKFKEELSYGGLQVDEWYKAFAFVGEKFKEVNDSLRTVGVEQRGIDNEIGMIQRELTAIRGARARTTKTVQIDIEMENSGEVTLDLEYMIAGATWKPIYDARLSDDGDQVHLTYFADVSQHTGEEWNDVEVSLSTVDPDRSHGPGDPATWSLSGYIPTGVIVGRVVDKLSGHPLPGAMVRIPGTRTVTQTDRDGRYRLPDVREGTYVLEVTSPQHQGLSITGITVTGNAETELSPSLEPLAGGMEKSITVLAHQDVIDQYGVESLVKNSVSYVTTNATGEVFTRGVRAGDVEYLVSGVPVGDPVGGIPEPALTAVSGSIVDVGYYATVFNIERRDTIPSGEKSVRVMIGQYDLKAATELVCRPRNTRGAYRVVKIINQDKAPFLPGVVSLFTGSDYLGSYASRNLIAPGQEFTLPFGRDDGIEVKREIVDSRVEHDGDRLKKYHAVKIVLTNHTSGNRTIRLEEPFPVSRDDRIKVRIDDIEPELSDDADEERAVWLVNLAPQKTGEYRFSVKIEHPANLRVMGL